MGQPGAEARRRPTRRHPRPARPRLCARRCPSVACARHGLSASGQSATGLREVPHGFRRASRRHAGPVVLGAAGGLKRKHGGGAGNFRAGAAGSSREQLLAASVGGRGGQVRRACPRATALPALRRALAQRRWRRAAVARLGHVRGRPRLAATRAHSLPPRSGSGTHQRVLPLLAGQGGATLGPPQRSTRATRAGAGARALQPGMLTGDGCDNAGSGAPRSGQGTWRKEEQTLKCACGSGLHLGCRCCCANGRCTPQRTRSVDV
mmetsp:Transcript_6430/g.23843  ORF Transcript_6430/g.23843 Transcript_6430/m.23843 type:complete len:264 (-) Transcript_6430:152-943(-)